MNHEFRAGVRRFTGKLQSGTKWYSLATQIDLIGQIVGALNEGDLMKVFYDPDSACVSAVMTCNPVTVSVNAPLSDVVDQLMSSDFRRVLIHDNHRLVGVITRSHLMPALLEALEERAMRIIVPEFH